MSSLRQPANRTRRQQLLLWVCGVVALALTMSRHWVICRHGDGPAHLEIDHPQGLGHTGSHHHGACACGHDHGAHGHRAHDQHGHDHGDGTGHPTTDPHDSCSHTELTIELGPEQQPDGSKVPAIAALALADAYALSARWPEASKLRLAPPATGPPRPPGLLVHRRTVLLLI